MNDSINELKREKTRQGISNEKLATLTGLNIATVGKIFCGIIKNPRPRTIAKITEAIEDFELNKPF